MAPSQPTPVDLVALLYEVIQLRVSPPASSPAGVLPRRHRLQLTLAPRTSLRTRSSCIESAQPGLQRPPPMLSRLQRLPMRALLRRISACSPSTQAPRFPQPRHHARALSTAPNRRPYSSPATKKPHPSETNHAPSAPRAAPSQETADPDAWVPSLARAIPGHSSSVDPFDLVHRDLDAMTQSLRSTVSVLQVPTLDRAASHLLSLRGKRVRPLIVLLMAHATSLLSRGAGASVVAASSLSAAAPLLLPTQRRLAEITELIHAASLLHDDVIDVADTRRGAISANSLFGNQIAVLAGDFLLARASIALARLRDNDVVELLSTVLEHLVLGEVLQLRGGASLSASGVTELTSAALSAPNAADDDDKPASASASAPSSEAGAGGAEGGGEAAWFRRPDSRFETYMAKTFFKTASLIANSSRAVVVLAGHPREVADAAYAYGENVGLAFQLIDDVLDLDSDADTLGKPVLNDLRQGIATAPVLFALERFPDLEAMVARKFSRDGDLEYAVECVRAVDGIAKTRDVARQHVDKAVDMLVDVVPPSEHRSALINIADFVLRRTR